MNDKDSAIKGIAGGLSTAVVSSICRIIPLILLILGIGLTAGLVVSGYRPYFVITGVIFIGIYIFIHIQRESRKCACSTVDIIRGEGSS